MESTADVAQPARLETVNPDPEPEPDDDVEAGRNPDLTRKLYKLLHTVDLGRVGLQTQLEQLKTHYHDTVYAELIFMLSHLRFSDAVACGHWSNIIEHQRKMQTKLEAAVDLRVAFASYFLEVNPSFRSPKLIEMRVFEQARASAYWDELTGLRNFRFFKEHLKHEVLGSRITGVPMSLVMIDVDDFKILNDTFGHEAGNRVLAGIAKLFPSALGEADVAARYGGEEFALVLHATPKHEARGIAERVREAVEHYVALPDDRRLSVSLGVATYPADARDADELVRHADRALYEAKFGGKNQVRLFRQSTRSFPRFDTTLHGSFTTQLREWSALKTIEIGQGGLHFQTSQPLEERSLLELRVELPGEALALTAVGRVVRVTCRGTQCFDVAVQFVELSCSDRARLNAHLATTSARLQGDASQRADPEPRR